MNYKTKYKQDPAFPVNYLKNHPETTTMNEAGKRPPKSSTFKLNFPKIKMPKQNQLEQIFALTSGFMARYVSLGGLIFLNLLKMAIKLMAKILTPILMQIDKTLNNTIDKFDEMSEDFYRFMDYFFLMDEVALIPIVVESNDGRIAIKKRAGLFSVRDAYKNFSFKMPHVAENAAKNKFSDTVISGPDSNPGSGNKKRFVSIKRNLPVGEKLFNALLETAGKIKLRFPNSNRIALKLPLKTIDRRLTPIKTLFKFPFSERVLLCMDSMIMREYEQNQFAHNE